jgi:hypothetical protein
MDWFLGFSFLKGGNKKSNGVSEVRESFIELKTERKTYRYSVYDDAIYLITFINS